MPACTAGIAGRVFTPDIAPTIREIMARERIAESRLHPAVKTSDAIHAVRNGTGLRLPEQGEPLIVEEKNLGTIINVRAYER